MSDTSTVIYRELGIPEKSYTEEETSAIMSGGLFQALDTVSPSRSAPAKKTALVDFFGVNNAGKTEATRNIDRFFRRHGCQVFCPPETAEIDEIRNKSTDNIIIFQARHVTGVRDYVLNLAHSRDFHLAVTSRGLIDMLYWYARWVEEGKCTERHREIVRDEIYELLRMDLVDAFFFFFCSPEESVRREYEESVTRRRGSNITEEVVAKEHHIYCEVLDDVEKNIPNLPIFAIDTTSRKIKETGDEVLRHLLPTLCSRFRVPLSSIFLKSPILLRKAADSIRYIEEQLKLRGHPRPEKISAAGWGPWHKFGEVEQEDFYLNTDPQLTNTLSPFGENTRIRKQGKLWLLYFKSGAPDHLLSHRHPLMVPITYEEAQAALARYPVTRKIKKVRKHFLLQRNSEGPKFTLHIDTIAGLGEFTEIRVLSEPDTAHTATLFSLAAELGFKLDDVAEGNYISLLPSEA